MDTATLPCFSPEYSAIDFPIKKWHLRELLWSRCRGCTFLGLQQGLTPSDTVILFLPPAESLQSTMSVPLAAFREVEVGVAQILFRLFVADIEGVSERHNDILRAEEPKVRQRFHLVSRIHKMISRDGSEWDSVIDNFRQIRSGRKQS